MCSVTELVRKWVAQGIVKVVVDDQEDWIDPEEADVNDWIIKLRTVGKPRK